MKRIYTKIRNKILRLFLKRYKEKQDFIELLERSEYFDSEWYLSEYPDVAAAEIKPELHYLNNGFSEGREPGPLFDAEYYLSQLSDVPLKYEVPLIHFEKIGKQHGLHPFREWNNSCWWKDLEPNRTRFRAFTSNTNTKKSKTTVIVPVYNGKSFLRYCLESLYALRGDFSVVLVNDGSTEEEVNQLLLQYASHENFTLLENGKNLGFTKSVNRAIELCSNSDILVLNSDTLVPPTLLQNLAFSAYSSPDIGTVTPFSNNAGPFTVSNWDQLTSIHDKYKATLVSNRMLSQAALETCVEVPTGHGFCLFIKAEVIDRIGMFDSERFPRGYGEENDFCLRLAEAGWKNVVDSHSFVYHSGGESFLCEKKELLERGLENLKQRYPNYEELIQKGFSSKAFTTMKNKVNHLFKAYDLISEKAKPRVLFFIATESGGTAKTNSDLMSALQQRYETFLIKCNARRVSLHFIETDGETLLETHYLTNEITPFSHYNNEYDSVVTQWLKKWKIELLHIRQIAWHSLGIVKNAKEIGIPTIYSIHDFYSICPSVKLLDEKFDFCGGRCTDGQGICQIELWPSNDLKELKHKGIIEWQHQFRHFLSYPYTFITTSETAKKIFESVYYDSVRDNIQLIPHGRDFEKFKMLALPPNPIKKIKLITLGTITKSKGADHLLPILTAFPNIEIHVVGQLEVTSHNHERLKIYGKYKRDKLSTLIEDIKPNWGLILSIWPETWCHTLTELWSCGIPTISFDVGAIGERTKKSRCGILAEHISSESLHDTIINALNAEVWQCVMKNIELWQSQTGLSQSIQNMANSYSDIYDTALSSTKKK